MGWRLAKGLIKLRDQINGLAPSRSKASDGSIGDTAHSARASDHNPNAQGVVTAIDITHDPKNGVAGHALASSLIADPRTKYVIFTGRIWKARTGQWEQYRGPNPHNKHVHISIKAERADDDRAWPLAGTTAKLDSTPRTLRRGDKGSEVVELQKKLGLTADGRFGPATEAGVRAFQTEHGLLANGVVDQTTWTALKST